MFSMFGAEMTENNPKRVQFTKEHTGLIRQVADAY